MGLFGYCLLLKTENTVSPFGLNLLLLKLKTQNTIAKKILNV